MLGARGVWKLITIIPFSLVAVSIVAEAHAQDTLPAWASSPVHVRRKALVIGIDKYENATQLVTTSADVVAVTGALRDLHFDDDNIDTLYTGGLVTYDQLVDRVAAFAATIRPDDVVLVYYSGHGAERKGENYLIPSEAVPHPAFLGSEWVSVSWVVSELSKAKPGVIVLVLDACRADPFTGSGIEFRDVFDPNLPPAAGRPLVETDGLVATSIPPKNVDGDCIRCWLQADRVQPVQRRSKRPFEHLHASLREASSKLPVPRRRSWRYGELGPQRHF